jgi:hypothetical protein
VKTFTTGELVQKLGIGQKAEMVSPVRDIIVERTADNGIIVLQDATSTKHNGRALPLTKTVMIAVWQLQRKKVTFLEAFEEIKQGKTIWCKSGSKETPYDNLEDLIMIQEAVYGQWMVEG